MVIYRNIEEVIPTKHSILTIGSFDGLHRGHQEIIKRVVTTAQAIDKKSVVITFDPHPKQILMDHHPELFELLLHIDKKLDLFEKLGVDITLVVPFDFEFSHVTAPQFIEDVLMNYFHPLKVIIGYDHHFGFRRKGDRNFLKSYEKEGYFEVEVVPEVRDQDQIISSSYIRSLIKEGYVRRASFKLGWIYGFKAIIVHGVGRGHLLTFPTANFIPKDKRQLIPKNGVYFGRGIFDKGIFYGMCNIGYRPTFGEKDFVMEIHFIDELEEDIYGQEIEVQFLERIRNEKKFETPEALIKQLIKDRQYCLSRIKVYHEEK